MNPLTSCPKSVTVCVDGTIPWGWGPFLINGSGVHHSPGKLLCPLHIWLPLFLPAKKNNNENVTNVALVGLQF